jgi:hypothetical protein
MTALGLNSVVVAQRRQRSQVSRAIYKVDLLYIYFQYNLLSLQGRRRDQRLP